MPCIVQVEAKLRIGTYITYYLLKNQANIDLENSKLTKP